MPDDLEPGWHRHPHIRGSRYWDGEKWGPVLLDSARQGQRRHQLRLVLGTVAATLLAVLLVVGAVAWLTPSSPSEPEAAPPADATTTDADAVVGATATPDQVTPAEATKHCMTSALQDGVSQVVTCGQQTYVICAGTSTHGLDHDGSTIRAVCRSSAFVALAWNSDKDHAFKRVRYAGRWVGRAVPLGQGTRQARPASPRPTAHRPSAPKTPRAARHKSPPPLVYTTDNDHGYTGPRCYEPGGKVFHPC